MKTCKFCLKKYPKLADSHVFPKSFFKYTVKKASLLPGESMRMHTNTKGELPVRKNQQGWYDQNLVCTSCEEIFGPYDAYAAELLIQNETRQQPVSKDGEIKGWVIPTYDHHKLRLFFISILWRAAASDMPVFKSIKLGSELEQLKTHIENDDSNMSEFSFFLHRFGDEHGQSILLDPYLEKVGGPFEDVRVFRFYLGAGYVAYIKIDNKPWPKEFQAVSDPRLTQLIIMRKKDFSESPEWELSLKMLSQTDIAMNKLKNS